MKLQLTHLGRIREAEIDLRPLTVLVGPNNTNKSWAAYAAHAAILGSTYKAWRLDGVNAKLGGDDTKLAHELASQCAPLIAGDVESVELSIPVPKADWTQPLAAEHLSTWLQVNPEALADFKATLLHEPPERKPLFTGSKVQLNRSGHGTYSITAKIQYEPDGQGAARTAVFPAEKLHDFLATEFGLLGFTTRWRCDAMPVERHLLFSAPQLSMAMLSELQGPALDFLHWVSMARGRAAPPPGVGNSELVALLQSRVFGGDLRMEPGGPVHFEAGGVKVPMQAAASMVRSLAPLALYLDRLARPGDVLVIDEPEMNAHPGAQLALAEIFGMMIRRGYRLLLTTHSPYLVEHLATLMEAFRLPPEAQERVSSGFLLQSADAFIDPGLVSVYEFVEQAPDHVEVVDILNRDEAVIDTRTFAAWTNNMGAILDDVLGAREP